MSSFCDALQSSSETPSLIHRKSGQKCKILDEKLYILLRVGNFLSEMFQQARLAVCTVIHSGLGQRELQIPFHWGFQSIKEKQEQEVPEL